MRRDVIETGHPLHSHAAPRRHDAEIIALADGGGLRVRYIDDGVEDVQGRQAVSPSLDSQCRELRKTSRQHVHGVHQSTL